MGMFDGLLQGAGGGIISAIGSLIGGQQTNAAAVDRQNAAQDFSAQQYATRYQTTVKDLEASGLNPMLAYSQGPGTSPTGTAAPVTNALGNAADSFNRGRATSAQSALQAEQVKQAESQTTLNSAQASKAQAEAQVANEQAKLIATQVPQAEAQTKVSNQTIELLMQQGATSAAQAKHYGSLIENLASQNKNLQAELTRLNQSNDQSAPEATIAKKYPNFYYIFHSLMPTLSGSMPNLPRITNVYK